MSIATVVTRGYGSFGTIADVTRRGYSGSATTVIGRRRRTKFYTTDLELPKTVQKKAEKRDFAWLLDHYTSLVDKAVTESRLRTLDVQFAILESQYQITELEAQANEVRGKLQEIEDDEDLLLLH